MPHRAAIILLLSSTALAQQLPPHARAVRADAPPGGNGQSWATAFSKIEHAIAAASASGGTITQIWIGPGTYTPGPAGNCTGWTLNNVSLYGGFEGNELSLEQRPMLSRPILQSSCNPHPTVRVQTTQPVTIQMVEFGSAYQDGLVIGSGPSLIDNVRFTNAFRYAILKTTGDHMVLSNCTITGSGFNDPYVSLGGPGLISHCHFNFGSLMGPGVSLANITVQDSILDVSGYQGSNYVSGVTFERCLLDFGATWTLGLIATNSHFVDCDMPIRGSQHGTTAFTMNGGSIRRCRLQTLSQIEGSPEPAATLNNALIEDSTVQFQGRYALSIGGTSSFRNVLFTGYSSVGGFSLQSATAQFTNCTFRQFGPTQSTSWHAFHLGPNSHFDNCIIWNTSYPPERTFEVPSGGLTNFINHSCIRGWTGALGGTGNIAADPLLTTTGAPNPNSPCIDAGNNAALPPNTPYDLARNCRIADGDRNGSFIIDMGAFEYPCYANADCSTLSPILNIADFSAFITRFAAADPYANCDNSTTPPTLNIADFSCFLTNFAAGCN